ncbi:hypothetical protein CLAIMM_14356, partial [Cladophialophora immunda]
LADDEDQGWQKAINMYSGLVAIPRPSATEQSERKEGMCSMGDGGGRSYFVACSAVSLNPGELELETATLCLGHCLCQLSHQPRCLGEAQRASEPGSLQTATSG